jgi:NAD+ kinase
MLFSHKIISTQSRYFLVGGENTNFKYYFDLGSMLFLINNRWICLMKKFQNIAIMGRPRDIGFIETLTALIHFLQQRQINVLLHHSIAELSPIHDLPSILDKELGKRCELLIVIGGDGSLLRAARIAADHDIPVLGINRGRLGFLTDIRPDALNQVGAVLDGHYKEEQRFLLTTTMHHEAKQSRQDTALNDVVLQPANIAHMIEFEILIDKQFVCSQRADGLIITTPTGSTAYALSAGGPILHPTLNAIVLVTICSHTLSSRPLVIAGDSLIELVVHHNETPAFISCDGQQRIPIPAGEKIEIRKKQEQLRLIHPTDYNYFETLRVKLGWEG